MVIAHPALLDMPLHEALRFAARTGQHLQTDGTTVCWSADRLTGFTVIHGGGHLTPAVHTPTTEAAR
jgi:hypothetical protein